MPSSSNSVESKIDHESTVRSRYGAAARVVEPALCCPTQYDSRFLRVIPPEILERDYGCGDPSLYVNEGETVVDLGSGTGKICYILSQRVGAGGRVIGVDLNDDMLTLARSHLETVAQQIGFANVTYRKARIQEMDLDLDRVADFLRLQPVSDLDSLNRFEEECERLRRSEPAVPDGVADVVVSNCVLNLVNPAEKGRLMREIHRVLRPGGRAVISDIVCDETPSSAMLADPELWSGCISGAFREDEFLRAFEIAGFYGIEILKREDAPWQVVEGIEFRSMTVRAFKGKEGPCLERNQAVIYRGPWREVADDDGHRYRRGDRMAVCDKTFGILTDDCGPYASSVLWLEPGVEIPPEDAAPFSCSTDARRDPRTARRGAEAGVPERQTDGDCRNGSCC